MIEKYTRPAMGAIWSEERKIALWLKVEIAVCEAWSEEGVIPAEALPAIRAATVDLDRMREIERETEHDVIAFLDPPRPDLLGRDRYRLEPASARSDRSPPGKY